MRKTNAPSTIRLATLAIAAGRAQLSPATLTAIKAWLVEQLVAQEYAKLGQGGHTQNQVPLRKVFVDLPITHSLSDVQRHQQRILFLSKLMSSDPINLRQACKPRIVGATSTSEILDEDDVIEDRKSHDNSFSSTLLIGGPGQGKSTLGQLACQLHRAALLKPVENELTAVQRELVQSFDLSATAQMPRGQSLGLPTNPLLPLQIALPDFAAWLAKETTNPVNDTSPLLLRFIADLPSARKCGIDANDLLALASHMPMLLVLDGFDEVGATQDRERLVGAARDLLMTLAHHGGHAQVIATTRPQGYAGELAQIGIPLKMSYLAPLLREEALEYAKKLVEAKISGVDLQTKALERIFEAANEPATERLLTTPLQVTILTALVQQLGRAPRERWNLFSRYFAYTYDREIERGTYASALLADHRSHIIQIHARVALLLQVAAERDGGASARMPRTRLVEVIDAVLSEDEVSEVERKTLVLDIAEAAENRLVFLVEPEPGNFGFEIRSLQEFMAAWALTSGRDAEIEARLLKVSKAPMFRNVVLFAASRLFSEGSPLRDVLAERICSHLDDDLSDELSNITRAGGYLALETLEEGAVLSQPKRARVLMERATGLLSLPPGNEHTRLARIANEDTASTLQNAINLFLSDTQSAISFNNQSAWISLIEAANLDAQWAIEQGNKSWPHRVEPVPLLETCARLGIPLGQWLATKIESSADIFQPEHFINLRTVAPESGIGNWVQWLISIFGNEQRWRLRNDKSPEHICSLIKHEHLGEMVAAVPEYAAPDVWGAWAAAARFECEPSAHTLATTLLLIAETLPKDRWDVFHWRSSWPLASCIGLADTPADLCRFAEQLRTGVLGDITEWRIAEANWTKRVDQYATLEWMTDGMPWTKESLKHSPPFSGVHIWMFAEQARRSQAGSLVATLEKANQLFSASKVRITRERLAIVCLLIIQRIPKKTLSLNLSEWLAEVPNGIGLLMPRPKMLTRSVWLSLFETSPEITDSWWCGLDFVIETLIETNAHPKVLKMAILSLELYSKHDLIHLRPDETNFDKAAESLNKRQTKSLAESAYQAILHVMFGTLPAEREGDLFQNIEVDLAAAPKLWASLLCALRFSRLPTERVSTLLRKTYVKMGAMYPQSSIAIQQLRDIFQSRKSDLGNHALWNQLALPLPYPHVPTLPRLIGGIPARPIRLESLELKDIGGLHSLKLPFRAPTEDKGQWVVIIGPNGIGKTTLLRSLALSMRNVKDPSIWPKKAFANSWQRVKGINEERSIDSQINVKLGDGIEHSTRIRPNGSISITQLPEQNCPKLFPLFAYGCRRGSALGGATREVDLKDDDGPEIATLFDEAANLIHAETWLIQLDGDAPKKPLSKAIFDSVIGALKTLLNLSEIEISDRKVWVVEPGHPKLPFSSLSDGYLTSAGWFLDLLARWLTLAEQHGEKIESDFMSRMRGLVLIDEIDLHLHPLWQIEIIARTRRLLPQMSFVVTTHNPLTLVGAKAEEIWILSEADGQVQARCGVEAPMLLTGGQIYRGYFGVDDIYPDGLGRVLQRYSFLTGYALRTDLEQTEMESLGKRLNDAGIEPGWEVVPRFDGAQLPLSKPASKKLSWTRKGDA